MSDNIYYVNYRPGQAGTPLWRTTGPTPFAGYDANSLGPVVQLFLFLEHAKLSAKGFLSSVSVHTPKFGCEDAGAS